MDSRRISAALGFTLLIGCVIGIVILIHSGGSTRRSSQQPSQIENHFWDAKEGFANDANYHSSQPTMQEVNELADELHRLLSKSKHVKPTQKLASVPLGRDINTKLRNGTDLKPFPSSSSSATSSVSKGSISTINYSIVPNNLQQKTVGGTGGGGLRTSNFSSSSSPSSAISLLNKNSRNNKGHPELMERQAETPQKYGPSATVENLKKIPYQHTQHSQYPGQQSPTVVSGLGPTVLPSSSSFSSAESGKERGGSLHDLYTTSWLPSMISQGIPASNMEHQLLLQHQQQHYHQQRNHYKFGDEDERPQPLSPFSENTHDKNGVSGKELLKRQGNNHEMVANSQTSAKVQAPTHSQGFDQKPHKSRWEDDDFIEDGLSDEEEAEDENDVVELEEEEEDINNNANHHRHHQHPPGDEEEEEVEEDEDDDEDDEDPEPKKFTAELETLLDLANHVYTSGANGTAFQGFLKVINETIQRGNNSNLLVELNEMYGRADITSNNSSSSRSSTTNATTSSSSPTASLFHDGGGSSGGIGDLLKKRDPYETSLTAFVFMSFGVFLLNQIHSFVQKTSLSNGNNSVATGRAFGDFDWYSPNGPMLITTESSSLDILFQPPPQPLSLSSSEGLSEKLQYEGQNRQSHHPKKEFLTTFPQQASGNRDNDTNNPMAPGVLASYEKIALSTAPSNANSTTTTVTTTTTTVAPTINSSNNSFHSETAKRNNGAGGEGGGGDIEKRSVVVSSSSAGSERGLDSVRMIIPLAQEENHEAPSSSTWSSSSFGEQGKATNNIIRSSSDVNGEAGGGGATPADGDTSSSSRSHEDNSFSSTHVNNMFRALLNIVNAYTKDSQALECIWSLYCQDLDKTAGKNGLYGVAARINSVGLRLIMNQIPPSLTMDVILRSLVGWDGLPCRKMFPE
ncbi:unnamed protein product [Orchesella dallaii]|uniref:Uncharacterized protein n=1 Tax=Orchesella dallaii TaxID=48710 RepID=A0ABP1QIV1_9HEXA